MMTPAAPAATPVKHRERWMDLVRGAAILLVVAFHASAVPIFVADLQPTQLVSDLNTFFAPYRMSTLLLLSGMLLARSLAKTGTVYFTSKLRTLVWPYLLWGAVYWLVTMQDGWTDPANWVSLSWLWFLFYLAIYYLAAPLLARIRGAWFAVVPVGLWVLSDLLSTPDASLDPLWSELAYYGGFFFAGHLLAQHRARLARFEGRGMLLACSAIAAVFSALLIAQSNGTAPRLIDRFELIWIPVVLAGIAAIIMLARRYVGRREGSGTAGWLQYIGRNSIVFYVVHYPVQIMLSSWFADWGMRDASWMLLINFVAAMGISWLFCWLRRFRVGDALFEFPRLAAASRTVSSVTR